MFAAIFDGFGLVGLWGYLRGIAIGWRVFWGIYLALLVVQIACGIAGTALFAAKSGTVMAYLFAIALFLLAAPQCWALWRYAFRSSAIWQAAKVAV
jgi:putative Ca2+/H+ antiporter (TMEM165/GDT1 family)